MVRQSDHPVRQFTLSEIENYWRACLFCKRTTFEQTGGFNTRYFVAEDIAFVKDIKRFGRFFIPNQTVITSARKLNQTSFWQMLPLLVRLIFVGPESFRSKKGLELWYDQAVRDG